MQTINLYLLAGILALAAPAYMAAQGSDAARENTIKKEALAGPARAKTNLTSCVMKIVAVGDVALVYTDFEGNVARRVAEETREPVQGDRGPSLPGRGRLEGDAGDLNGRERTLVGTLMRTRVAAVILWRGLRDNVLVRGARCSLRRAAGSRPRRLRPAECRTVRGGTADPGPRTITCVVIDVRASTAHA
jgi:hypothetical protein